MRASLGPDDNDVDPVVVREQGAPLSPSLYKGCREGAEYRGTWSGFSVSENYRGAGSGFSEELPWNLVRI